MPMKLLKGEKPMGKRKNKFFICEICHEKTPIECEGAEPNTCAMCMPLCECDL